MSVSVTEGDVLAGKYQVEQVLGRGGMGVVVAATHLTLGQKVAIKVLLEGANDEVIERFLREGRAAVRLKSEHVARVTDVGELPDGLPYMVMEYLEGSDLAGVLKAGRVSTSAAVGYLLEACEAVAEAHACGIVHRDLKPANLFLTRAADGTKSVKVLDFGISKAAAGADEEGMGLTQTQAILGSPYYMSPEQMRASRDVDARSDIWSLGIILYELIAGSRPFKAAAFTELVLKVAAEAPPPLTDAPPGLEAVVLRCLEKQRDNRYPNIAELAWDLVPFGPERCEISAERAHRMLEAAGIVTTAPPSIRAPSAAAAPVAAAPAPVVAAAPAPVAEPALTAGTASALAPVAAPASTPPAASTTSAVSVSAMTMGGSSPGAATAVITPPKQGRGLMIGVGVVALIGVAAAAVALTRPAPAVVTKDLPVAASAPPAAPTAPAAIASTAQAAPTPPPEVAPAITTTAAAEPSATAAASARAPVKTVRAPVAPPAPAPAAPGKKSPLDVQIK